MEKDAAQPESTPESVSQEEFNAALSTLIRHELQHLDTSCADVLHIHLIQYRESTAVNVASWAERLKTDPENGSAEKETVEPLNR